MHDTSTSQSTDPDRYETRGAKERIYIGILNDIISGELASGERLFEEEIGQRFKTSRTPVREAFFALERDGLIERKHRHGARVAKFTPVDVDDLYTIRQALESCCIRKAAENVDLNELLELKYEIEETNRGRDAGTLDREKEIDRRLHHLIVSSSGNKRLIAYYESIALLMVSLQLISYRDVQHAQEIGEQHLAIVEALLRRDASEAERLLTSHIEEGRRNAVEVFFRHANKSRGAVESDPVE